MLPGYPKKIRDFALNHLKNCGIKVITEARASKVTANEIFIYDKKSQTTSTHPYGICVWATGVQPGPLIQKLLSKLPVQSSYRSLKTDAHCQVIGAPGVYAIGDCADIDVQAEYVSQMMQLFDKAKREHELEMDPEQDHDALSLNAHQEFIKELQNLDAQAISAPGAKIIKEVSQELDERTKLLDSSKIKKGITKKSLLDIIQKHMDRQKALPPTAQVAHQQGEYLAKLFNNPKIDATTGTWSFSHGPTFAFRNMGQLVYVGGHMAALSVPASKDIDVSWNGSLTNLVWHAAYFGMLESVSARLELIFDWAKSSLFGRSTALDAICTSDATDHVNALRRGGGGGGGGGEKNNGNTNETPNDKENMKKRGVLSSLFFKE